MVVVFFLFVNVRFITFSRVLTWLGNGLDRFRLSCFLAFLTFSLSMGMNTLLWLTNMEFLFSTSMVGITLTMGGVMVVIFQAATSINEQTMSFLPRLLVTLLALSWGGNWLVQQVMDFTFRMAEMIPQVVG